MIIIQGILGYFTIGFFVYLYRFSFTNYLEHFYKYLDKELSDFTKRKISKTLGSSVTFGLIYIFDIAAHLVKWPRILFVELKIAYANYKIWRLEGGISKMKRGLKKISDGKVEEGRRLLDSGRKTVDKYTSKEN